MNQDIFEGKRNQIRGRSKVWWGQLTGDDFQMDGAAQ
jgi:uncharacterized protein YjbJ (UPF0337 family)